MDKKPDTNKPDPLAGVKKKMQETEAYVQKKAEELDLRMTLFLQLKQLLLTKEGFVINNLEDFEKSLDSVQAEIPPAEVDPGEETG